MNDKSKIRLEDTDPVDALLVGLEPLVVRAQFKQAIQRLQRVFEETIEEDGLDSGRRLIELTHLLGGNRRFKHMSVEVGRRRNDDE